VVASKEGHIECVRVLLDAGADVAQATQDGSTALLVASQKGHLESVRVLLDAGADVAHAMQDGLTVLMLASQEGHIECVRVLLDAGADAAQATQDGLTALLVASQKGHIECVRVLLDAGADVTELSRSELAAVVLFYLRAAEQGDADAPGALAELASRREVARACCMACGARHALKICTRCKIAKFCNADCATRAWPAHRPHCKAWLAAGACTA
jgi:ankyrin repeat protein